ncbi:MAG: hypothetical protein HY261_01045 [Chloroflexi bacterium]|nr:hypothetical protein [Chloroflexota bacterium]
MSREILLRKEGGVARITLSRPPGNAIDDVLAATLHDACQEVVEDDAVSVVIITGPLARRSNAVWSRRHGPWPSS